MFGCIFLLLSTDILFIGIGYAKYHYLFHDTNQFQKSGISAPLVDTILHFTYVCFTMLY